MGIWTVKFINDLPDSAFAWIQPSGKKDSGGKTVPRSLRHLPYKDSNGKVDLPHLRNALARLSQVKGMPESVRTSVKARLSNLLNRMTKKAEKIEDFNITFETEFSSVKILKGEKGTIAVIKGRLIDDSMNANFWKVESKSLPTLSSEVKGLPVKLQHSKSDWDLIGEGKNGVLKDNTVHYISYVTDEKAVSKFETKTWTADNMGVSPSIDFKSIKCSICKKEIECFHKHQKGMQYGGKTAYYIVQEPHLKEMSLTTDPAYTKTAGTIDNVGLVAELNKILRSKKEMSEETETSADVTTQLIEQKDTKIEELKASIIKKDDEIGDFKKEAAKTEKKTEETAEKAKKIQSELESVKASLKEKVKEEREAEVKKRVTDEKLIAEIVEKDMSDKEFKAELKRIDKIQAQASTNTKKGSVSTEKSGKETLEEAEKRIGKELFGNEYDKIAEAGK